MAMHSLEPDPIARDRRNRHKLLGATSGALGGFFGLPGMLVELPISTTLMLRSVAHVAQQEGEDLADLEARMACIQVFAFGGRAVTDNAAETGYYAVRLMLAYHFSSLTERAAERLALEHSLPATVNIVRGIAARFGLVISEKAAAQTVPFLGAAGGALINTMFMQHYQDMARGHFVLRRLERSYGQKAVQKAYEGLTKSENSPV